MENTKANYERVSKDIEKMLAKRAKAKAAVEGEITAERAKLEQRQKAPCLKVHKLNTWKPQQMPPEPKIQLHSWKAEKGC